MRIFLGAITALVLAAITVRADATSTNLFLKDDFDTGEHYFYEGMLEDRNFQYVDGEYEIDTTGSQDYGQSIVLGDLKEYMVQAQARLVLTNDPNGGGYGLAFNYREGDEHNDFMLFLVYDKGAYAVLRYLGGKTDVITAPARTGLLKPAEMNTLAVDVADGAYNCMINGKVVANGKDDTLTEGGAGLFGTAQSITHFDNFEVYADPPPEPVIDGFDGEIKLHNGPWDGVDFSYTGGQYLIDTTGSADYGLSPFPGTADDFEFAADVQLVAGTAEGGYGLYARDGKDGDGNPSQLRFLICAGWFCVEQTAGGAFNTLADWQKSDAIRSDGANRLKATLDGADLTFFINGVEVWHGTDPAPVAGAYGFIASEGIKVAFDNSMYLQYK